MTENPETTVVEGPKPEGATPTIVMTDSLATLIKQWRVEEGYTVRGIAFMAHKMGSKHEPASDLEAGKRLLAEAAAKLGEKPWEART